MKSIIFKILLILRKLSGSYESPFDEGIGQYFFIRTHLLKNTNNEKSLQIREFQKTKWSI